MGGKKNPKEKMLNALKEATEATIQEQDVYRNIIDKNEKTGLMDHHPGLCKGGWKEVLSVMGDCRFPPYDEERNRFLNLGHDQSLHYIKLQEIEDFDIRAMTYFLNRTIEQTQRLHAMAMFCKRLGHLRGRGNIFGGWARRSAIGILKQEAEEMGMKAEAKTIGQILKSDDGIGDFFLEIWRDPEKAAAVSKSVQAAFEELDKVSITS